MNADYIYEVIEKKLTPARFAHTIGVAKTVEKLSLVYGADSDKAVLAALAHDMYKCVSVDELNKLVSKYGLPDKYYGNPNLAHSQIAACELENVYRITDEDVLNSVKYHTTGRPNMSLLEKIIYIGDAIEPGRHYDGVEDLRELAFVDIDRAICLSLKRTVDHILEKYDFIDEDTIKALEYYKELTEGKSLENGEEMDSKDKALLVAKRLDDRKAENVSIIDIKERSSFADYLVIATGTSQRQVLALADDAKETFDLKNIEVKNIEGQRGQTGWVLLDYGDVVINIFTEEMREKYGLEKIWADCGIITLED